MTHEIREITVRARGLAFPALSCGEGPLVLCLHGFPDCLRSFRHQLPAFAAAGYRAVAPALRGYAPSCMPELSACNALEVARDAVALVEALGERRAHLVGHDWGAVSTYLAVASSPSTWLSASTLAIPHPLGMVAHLKDVPRQLRLSWYMAFFQLPGLPERTIYARDFAFIERLWRDWSPSFVPEREELNAVKSTFALPGVVPAALAYYRNMFRVEGTSAREARRLLSKRIDVPKLALTGVEDGCIDTHVYDYAMGSRRFGNLLVERMRGVGHFLHQEDPVRVSARLLAFMREHA